MKRFEIEIINSNLENVTINTNLVNCVVEGIRIDRNRLGYAPKMSVTKIFLDEVNAQNTEDSIVKVHIEGHVYILLLSKSSNTEINILTLLETSKNVYEVTNLLRSNNATHIERHIIDAMNSVELGSMAGCNIFDEIMKNELKEVETLVEVKETKTETLEVKIDTLYPEYILTYDKKL